MTYDLHIHSCLSPCAADDCTPASIAGFARLCGIDLIAVTDHNTAENLPAAAAACAAYGVRLLPGIEVNTREEIHLLTYLPTIEAALELSARLHKALPDYPYDAAVWGRQLVVDADDRLLREEQKLLTGAVDMGLEEVAALCVRLGGLAVPAHIDRDSYSLLSVLGFVPEEPVFPVFEVARPEHTLEALYSAGRVPRGREILTSSDAHTLADISEHPRELADDSLIRNLLV